MPVLRTRPELHALSKLNIMPMLCLKPRAEGLSEPVKSCLRVADSSNARIADQTGEGALPTLEAAPQAYQVPQGASAAAPPSHSSSAAIVPHGLPGEGEDGGLAFRS